MDLDPETPAVRATYTVEETAEKLGVNRNTIYEALKRGELPSIRVGRRILVPAAALDRLLTGSPTSAA